MIDSKIRIVNWNARGIRTKQIEFVNFLNSNNIDIAIVTETWLDSNINLSTSGFKCYRVDRVDRRGGGVAILIKRSIQHSLLPIIKTKVVENLVIDVRLDTRSSIKVVCVYYPGGANPVTKRLSLQSDLRKLLSLSEDFVIGGDLNCRHRDWGCTRANSCGNLLANLLATYPVSVLYPSSPTYFPAGCRGSASVLDTFLTNVPSYFTQPISINALSSDHNPVLCEILMSGMRKVEYFLDIKNANWKHFRRDIKSKLRNKSTSLDGVTDKENVDSIIQDFSSDILSSISACTPRVTKNDFCLKLPSFILELIKIRNGQRRNWQRYRQPIFKQQYLYLNKIISYHIQSHRNAAWNQRLSQLDKGAKPFWNIAKIIRNKNKQIPSLHSADTTYFTDLEKANLFAGTFLKNHEVAQNLSDVSTNTLVNNTVNEFSLTNTEFPPGEFVTEEDIEFVVGNLQLKKVGGFDGIRNVYIKKLPKVGFRFLAFIMNACLKTQYFPDDWKTAKVVPLLKSGKPPGDPASYRPISLLSSLSKVYEKIIKEKILQIVSDRKIFPDEQFGFRRYHSTAHQVFRICRHIKLNRAVGKSTGMLLLDIEKAFDSVWHNGLIFKMLEFRFPVFLCKIVQSFLYSRHFRVSVNNTCSDLNNFYAGVPQGSVLGPVLYNIYTSDFPYLPECKAAIYADDTAIFTSHEFALAIETNLNNAIQTLTKYYHKWKIKVNVNKMQAIFFSRKRKSCFLPSSPIHVNGIEVKWEPCVQYLGVTLDTKLTFNDQISKTIKKINIAIKMLYPLINRKSLLSNNNKIIIHKVVFQAILLYGCQVWGDCAKCHIKRLQVSQNKLLKMMLNLPWHHSTLDVHRIGNVELISDRIQKLTNKFVMRCGLADNELISQLFQ